MKQFRILSFLLVAVLAGCNKPTPVVVLDSWWNADFAKQACVGKTCVPDPLQGVRDFEFELVTQFAAQQECSSVQLIRFNGPNENNRAASEAMQKQYWNLSLNYSLGTRKQHWQMIGSPDRSIVTQGEGVPNDIAREVCSVVNERGARTMN